MATTFRQRTYRMDLEVWKTLGSFISVEVTGTSKLFATVRWDALGIPTNDPRIKEITPGRRAIVPRQIAALITRLEGQARANLDRYSQPTGLPWKDFRFIPSTAYTEWESAHEAIVADFYAAKALILGQWDVITEDTVQLYADFAARAWPACRALDPATPGRTEFVQKIIGDAMAALTHRKARLAADLQIHVSRAVLEDSAELAQRIAQLEHAQLEAAGFRADRDVLKRMKELELAQAQRDLEAVGSPVRQIMDRMMAELYEGASEVAATLQNRGYLPAATLQKARAIGDIYRLFAVQSHAELEDALTAVNASLSGATKPGASAAAAAAALDGLRDLTQEAAERIARLNTPSRSAMMMLDDDEPDA
jgi:hypothetical protein